MPPGVNLLPLNLMALRNLSDACAANPKRHDNFKLVLVAPETPPLHPKKFASHHRPRIRDVSNDVISDVS